MEPQKPRLKGTLPKGTVWPPVEHINRIPVQLKGAPWSASAPISCPCNQGISSFRASNLSAHLKTMKHNAFINECLSTLHPNGSSLLPYMVANLEQGETLVFKPEEANAKEQDDEMAPPPAKRHCPASTTNNNVTMAVDRASSSPNGRKVAATSEENSDIDPPLVNAIARLHDVCKTHDIGPSAMMELLKVLRNLKKEEEEYVLSSTKVGQRGTAALAPPLSPSPLSPAPKATKVAPVAPPLSKAEKAAPVAPPPLVPPAAPPLPAASTHRRTSSSAHHFAEPPRSLLHINIIRCPSGNRICNLFEYPDATGRILKSQIQVLSGIPPDQQRLIYQLKQVEDAESLADLNFQDGGTINLVTRMRGG